MSQRAGQSIEVNFDTKVETLLVDDAMLILREDDINISDEEDRVDSFVEDEPAAKRSIMDVAAHAAGGLGTHAVGILGIDKDALQGSDERSMEMVGLEAQWFIIHPHSLMLKIWDSIQALIVTYLFFYLPIVIAFKNTDLELQVQGLLLEGEEPPTMHTTYDYIIDAILLMDYLTRPLRAYYHIDYYGTQVLVVDPAQITVKWLRGGFFRDSLSCLPFDAVLRLAGHPKTASWVRGLRLLRMESVIQVKSNLDTALDEAVGSSWLRPLVSSVSLLIMALFFNHVLACFLYFFGHPKWDVELSKSADAVAWATQNPERSTREYCHEVEGGRCGWVQEMEYEPRTSDFTKYIDAFYYSFTILTTVGFGDISAHATRERVAAVFAMILGCAVFGIVMGQITAVLHGLHMGQARYEEKIRELEQYMEYRGLSHSLRERAKRFYIRKFPTKRLYDEKQILMGLPQGLRTEFLLDMNKVHIEKLPFVPKDDHPVMIAVCRALKQETFMPGEIVAREGAVGRSVFLVMSGVVSVLVARSEAARLGIHRQREAQRRKHGMQSRRYLSMDVESTFDLDEQPSPSQLPEASEDDSSTMVNPLAQDRVAGVNDEPAVGSEAADSEDWDEVRRLDDGHYFSEFALFYEVPRSKRYRSLHMSTVGMLDKDDLDAIMEDYPGMNQAVRRFALKKLDKLQTRRRAHNDKTAVLSPARLRDTNYDYDMLREHIESWGEGEKEIVIKTQEEEEEEERKMAGKNALQKSMHKMKTHVALGGDFKDLHNMAHAPMQSSGSFLGGMFSKKKPAPGAPTDGNSYEVESLAMILEQLEEMEASQQTLAEQLKILFMDRPKIEAMRRDLRELTDQY